MNDHLVDEVAQKGAYLKSQLEAKLGQHPHIGDIRGRGLFIGIEFVASQEDKTPFDPALNIAGNLKRMPLNRGWPVILPKARLMAKQVTMSAGAAFYHQQC